MGLLDELLSLSGASVAKLEPSAPSTAPSSPIEPIIAADPVIPSKARPTLPDLTRVHAERLKRSFALFVKEAWPQIDPAPLVWGKHMEAICACLQAVAEGRINKLLINVPPGMAKSILTSVLWPAWVWTRDPSWSCMVASYELGLPMGFAVKMRELTLTPWYQRHFVAALQSPWKYKSDQDLKANFANTSQGYRMSLSVGGKGTGFRARVLVIDDPLKAEDAHSAVALATATRWYGETMTTRSNDPGDFPQVMICQRLHEADLSALWLKLGDCQHLNLMMNFDPKRKSVVKAKDGSIIFEDWRTAEGELLFPERFGTEVVRKLRKSLGSYAAASQLDQLPSPAAGGVVKRAWLNRRWIYPGSKIVDGFECRELPLKFDTIEIHCDAAFKKTDTSDLVAVGVLGKSGPHVYLLDMLWRRMGLVGTMAAIASLRLKWRGVSTIAVEDKANGPAVIELFKMKIAGILAIEPMGSKEARIHACSKWIEAGNFWLPVNSTWGEEGDPQVGDFVEEACSFPMAAHDDGIDMVSQALNRMCTDADLAWLEMWMNATTPPPMLAN